MFQPRNYTLFSSFILWLFRLHVRLVCFWCMWQVLFWISKLLHDFDTIIWLVYFILSIHLNKQFAGFIPLVNITSKKWSRQSFIAFFVLIPTSSVLYSVKYFIQRISFLLQLSILFISFFTLKLVASQINWTAQSETEDHFQK